jgi:F420-dependent oxidoreductase-like protein
VHLGVNLVHDGAVQLARTAEALGYGLALAPEGNRSDAPSVLGAAAAATDRIGLASGVMQIPARTPALAALTAATLDELSGGRFRLGLGVSNADVADGWYGEPYDRPLERTREYVAVVRAALRREPVRFSGRHYRLPHSEAGSAAPLRLPTAPVRADLPVYLAAVGPRNLRLAGEIADGWIGAFTPVERVAEAVKLTAEGAAAAGRDPADFAVIPSVAVSVQDDPRRAADALRAHTALLLGIGDPARNVYRALAGELGFGEQIDEVCRLRAGGDAVGAAAAVPFAFIDRAEQRAARPGPPDRGRTRTLRRGRRDHVERDGLRAGGEHRDPAPRTARHRPRPRPVRRRRLSGRG